MIKDCLDGRIPADELELDLAVKIEIDKESFELILQDLEEA